MLHYVLFMKFLNELPNRASKFKTNRNLASFKKNRFAAELRLGLKNEKLLGPNEVFHSEA